MPLRDWFRPPRSLLTAYLAGALLAMASLVWLAVRLVDQEADVLSRRAISRLDAAADRAATASERMIAQVERLLDDDTTSLPSGIIQIREGKDGVHVRPDLALAYLPVVRHNVKPSDDVFRDGESAEFGTGGPAAALATYQGLIDAESRAVRAGALHRTGRVLRTLGRQAEALKSYAALEQLPDVTIAGRPADLLAREARCTILEQTGSVEELRTQAGALRTDLLRGRWPIAASLWEFLFDEATGWISSAASLTQEEQRAVELSRVAAWFWQERPAERGIGNVVAVADPGPALIVWKLTPDGIRAIVSGPDRLHALAEELNPDQEIRTALLDRDNRLIAGALADRPAVRSAASTGLPWTVATGLAEPGRPLAEARSRNRLLLTGLLIVGVLILGSGYFTFRGMQRELASAQLQSEFVTAVSHEFRTPLTSIVQLSRMLRDGRVIDETRRPQYYEALTTEGERLHRLVERLLSFGRAEAGRFKFEPVDAASLAQDVVGEFRKHAGETDVQLAGERVPCPIRADREMLSLALWNLLDNARKYSPAGSPVRVVVSRTDDTAAIAVRDEGPGVAPEDRERIFERFVRGTAEPEGAQSGTGIGLALVRQVIRAHGGEIRLESELGRGSTFTILMPAEAT